jgi:hypothetical protein
MTANNNIFAAAIYLVLPPTSLNETVSIKLEPNAMEYATPNPYYKIASTMLFIFESLFSPTMTITTAPTIESAQ